MKNTPTVLAALLAVCCLPSANAWADEANLSPNTNGGTAHLPSGYSQLNFLIRNTDWAPELRLPTAPSHGDRVSAMSDAMWSARIDLTGTVFESAAGAPFLAGTLLDFAWNAEAGRWDVQDGPSARALRGPNLPVEHVASTHHLLTQYTMSDGLHAGELHLPAQAHDNALLTVANRATWSTRINAAPGTLKGDWHACSTGQDCTFAYDANANRWRGVGDTRTLRPATQLAFPVRSLVRVEAQPALDPTTRMTLPATGVHGDVYVFLDKVGLDGHRVETTHTTMSAAQTLQAGREVRLRFNAMYGAWDLVQ